MSTQQSAPTLYTTTKSLRYAYRYFGEIHSPNPPLMFLQHFRGTMDHWDPALINPLALTRPILLFDNAGVGNSGGEVADSFSGWADHVISFLTAFLPTIGKDKVDLFGFSMGGMCAQMVALNAPHLIRKLILGGTAPSAGEGVVGGDPEMSKILAIASTDSEEEAGFLKTFYSPRAEKQELGRAWWKRMNERVLDGRSPYLDAEGTGRQITAVTKWLTPGEAGGSYDRLSELKMPVFVANGDNDVLVPTENSWVLSCS